tara:strand:- start:1242 stop:1565 length:324 start_codon:yes stop_codon:yes gene_type:complete
MKTEKVSYKKALRKNMLVLVLLFLSISALAYFVDFKADLITSIAVIIVIGVGGIVANSLVKQTVSQVKCSSCNADLYQLMETCKSEVGASNKLEFNYCPTCGHKLNV